MSQSEREHPGVGVYAAGADDRVGALRMHPQVDGVVDEILG